MPIIILTATQAARLGMADAKPNRLWPRSENWQLGQRLHQLRTKAHINQL
jgi:hypothetical protein